MPDTSLIAVGGAAVAASALFALVSWKDFRAHRAWCATKQRARGVVSRIALRGHLSRNRPTESDNNLKVPIVRFTAGDGAEYEIDAPDAPHRIGTEVEVAYDPDLPSDGRPVARTPKIGCTVVILAAGLALIVAGLLK